jgi:MoxR-like ATPase
MEAVEPAILAALINADPLLLIGPHGVGKSYLLNRLAAALGLSHRHYNASLLSFDDLVGYPLPNAAGALDYIQTPASIWGAQAVFLDEISRCRPEVQNKLFSIVHERRVQGLPLPDLEHRWSAMNPPASGDDSTIYSGSEPLDAALADRFSFVIEIPDWQQLPHSLQEQLIRSEDTPPVLPDLPAQIARGRALAATLRELHSQQLAAYIRLICASLRLANLALSPRRAVMLLRNLAGVHAARLLLDPNAKMEASAWLTLRHSIPQRATGEAVPEVALLTAHKEAWKQTHLEAGSPFRHLFAEPDPLRRALLAISLAKISRQELSSLIADSLTALPNGARHALATYLMESGAAGRLAAAVAQQCAQWYAIVATPQNISEVVSSGSVRHRVWQHIARTLARFPDNESARTNLLVGLFANNTIQVEADVDRILQHWEEANTVIQRYGKHPTGMQGGRQ